MQKTRVKAESGNALIYVLIAIVLFAALGFSLSRQTGGSNTKEIDQGKATLYSADIITYSTQAKSVLDQMMFTGTDFNEFDFVLPSEAAFNTPPHIHKVFHPQGGGLVPANLAVEAINQNDVVTPSGWYIGLFNNVEWTKSTGTDVMITAHQIAQKVCEEINLAITGSTTIPVLGGDLDDYLVDTATDNDLDIADCAGCEGYLSLCVSNAGADTFSYYSVVAER